MSVSFKDEKEIIRFLEKAEYYIVTTLAEDTSKHFLIVGSRTKETIGCTNDRMDVLMEEPDVKFQEIRKELCWMCE